MRRLLGRALLTAGLLWASPACAAQEFTARVVEVADGIALDGAIHIVDIAHPRHDGHASCTGIVVRLGAGSTATVVESRVGHDGGFGGSNVRTTVTLGEDAEFAD